MKYYNSFLKMENQNTSTDIDQLIRKVDGKVGKLTEE